MRRLIYLPLLATIVALTGVTVAWSDTAHGRSPSQLRLEHNRQAAHADAVRMIRAIRLPAAARKTARLSERRGDPLEEVMTSYTASVRYLAPTKADAYRYVLHHRPRGTSVMRSELYQVLKNGNHVILARYLRFSFPTRQRALLARELQVAFKQLKDGETRITLTSQSGWVIPRPTAERVPATVAQVTISGTSTGKHRSSAWAQSPITSRAGVRRLIELVDRPGISQDVVDGCPAEPGSYPRRSVTLRFENAAGATLASVSAYWSGRAAAGATGTECNAINFTLGGRSEPGLIDMSFLEQLHRLTEISLDR